jgi:hypothetical protein
MSLSKIVRINLLVAIVAIGGICANAARVPVRQSSDNGTGGNAIDWSLLGRTAPITMSGGGKSVTMMRQVICPNQDVADEQGENSAAGACSSGDYVFLYQFESSSKNVTIELSGIEKGSFSEVGGDDSGTYGVMICNAGNDHELCTEDSGSPGYANLAGITFAVKSSTSVSFTVPSFPYFPAGGKPEGQGLTLFIATHQSSSVPIYFPTVSVQ